MNIYIYIRIERRKKRTETFKRRKHSLTFSIIHLCFYSLADFLLLREKCTFKKQQTTNYKIELYKNTNNNNPPAASAPCQMPDASTASKKEHQKNNNNKKKKKWCDQRSTVRIIIFVSQINKYKKNERTMRNLVKVRSLNRRQDYI
jgi:hypothetical protein